MLESYLLYDESENCMLSLTDTILDENYKAELHIHPWLEISFIKSGSGLYHIDDRLYELRTGDVVVISSTEHHCIEMLPGGHLVNCVIHFNPDFLCSSPKNSIDYRFLQIFFERSAKFSNILDRDNPATAGIYQLLHEIQQELMDQLPGYELMIKIKLQNVFANIIRYYDYCPNEEKPAISARDLKIIREVYIYISDHLNENLTLEDLSGIANMSPSYFSTFFKKHNGLSPFEYITNLRVRRAIELIQTSNRSLTDIAFSCGFNNSTSFNKAFHRVVGKPPSHYRPGSTENNNS